MAYRMLLVDDDLETLEALADVFEAEGFSVARCDDSTRAIELLVKGLSPDVVITDQVMPLVLGDDVIRFMRRTPGLEETPVIVLSGAPPSDHPEPTVATFRKPVDLQALVEAVRGLILARARKEAAEAA